MRISVGDYASLCGLQPMEAQADYDLADEYTVLCGLQKKSLHHHADSES